MIPVPHAVQPGVLRVPCRLPQVDARTDPGQDDADLEVAHAP